MSDVKVPIKFEIAEPENDISPESKEFLKRLGRGEFAVQDKIKESNPKDAIGSKKAPMSTVSAPVLAEIGLGMLEGAIKYRRHNYRAIGVRASVYYDATMRHLFQWWEGEDVDADSGMNHITKAITSLVVLRDAMIRDKMVDDRPPGTIGFIKELNKKTQELLDKYEHHEQPYTHEDTGGPDLYKP